MPRIDFQIGQVRYRLIPDRGNWEESYTNYPVWSYVTDTERLEALEEIKKVIQEALPHMI